MKKLNLICLPFLLALFMSQKVCAHEVVQLTSNTTACESEHVWNVFEFDYIPGSGEQDYFSLGAVDVTNELFYTVYDAATDEAVTGSLVNWSGQFSVPINVNSGSGNYYVVVTGQFGYSYIDGGDLFSGTIFLSDPVISNNFSVNFVSVLIQYNINSSAVNTSAMVMSLCETEPILLNGAISDCEEGYFLSVQETDGTWDGSGYSEVSQWFTGQVPNGIDIKLFASQNGVYMLPGRSYRVKLATGSPTWVETVTLIHVDCCDPNGPQVDFALNDDFGATHIFCDGEYINLRAGSSTCEDGYTVSFQESNGWTPIGQEYSYVFFNQWASSQHNLNGIAYLAGMTLEGGKQYLVTVTVSPNNAFETHLVTIDCCIYNTVSTDGWDKKNLKVYALNDIRTYDTFYPGDFTNDGVDEVFALRDDGFMTLFKSEIKLVFLGPGQGFEPQLYFTPLWTNNGVLSSSDGIEDVSINDLLIGDFDGDGKDEIFGFDYLFQNWSMFEFDGVVFVNERSGSNGGLFLVSSTYNSKISVGDFNGDGRDEMVQTYPFSIHYKLSLSGSSWSSVNIGTSAMSGKKFTVADFDDDGKDELLGVNEIGQISMWEYAGGFNTSPVSGGNNDIVNQNFSNTILLSGNFDDFDSKDEISFMNISSNTPNEGIMSSYDFTVGSPWFYLEKKWSNDLQSPGLLDWRLNTSSLTNSFVLKLNQVSGGLRDFIIMTRKCNGGGYLKGYKSTSGLDKIAESINNPEQYLDLNVSQISSNIFDVDVKQELSEEMILSVYDLRGAIIQKRSFSSETNLIVNLTSSPKGIYLIQVTSIVTGKKTSKKVGVE